MKEKLIKLFTKVGNETDTFAPFITCDQFENLADEIVTICNLHIVTTILPSDNFIENNGKEGGLRDDELQMFWEGAVWLRGYMLKKIKHYTQQSVQAVNKTQKDEKL